MEQSKESPLPTDVVQKNAPLAPSQELAYRKKCIQLKRRLQEIEANNDATRKRIEREKQHVQKMRLNRAILLDHLRNIMDTPGKKLSPDQLAELGIVANGAGHPAEFAGPNDVHRLQDGEGLLDDSSDESEEEPEPAERPERRRRTNPPHGEAIMSTMTNLARPIPPTYPSAQPGLPNIAPANSFSPIAGRNPSSYSFQMESGAPQAPVAPAAGRQPYQIQQPTEASHFSPHQAMTFTQLAPPPSAIVHEAPPRPDVPFQQFTDHMRPQLEADDYPAEQIETRIQQEWANLSPENRGLWDSRYQEQMADFTELMDKYKRQQRQQGGSFSESRNRTVPPSV